MNLSESASTTGSLPSELSDIRSWQNKVLSGVLQAFLVLGVLLFFAGLNLIWQTYQQEENSLTFLATVITIYLVGLVGVAFITYTNQLNYVVRAGTLLVILYGLGVLGLVLVGLSSNGRIFLLAFVLLTAVLFNRRSSLIAIGISVITMIGVGWLFVNGSVTVPVARLANSMDFSSWVSGTAVFLAMSTALVLSITTLMQSLHTSLLASRKEQAYLTALLSAEEDRRQLLLDQKRQTEQLKALHETALDIITHRNMEESLKAIIVRAANLLRVAGGDIYLVEPDQETLTMVAINGPGSEFLGTRLKRGEGMVGWVLENGRSLIISDYDSWPGRAAVYPANLWSSAISVPLLSDNNIIGVLSCHEANNVSHTFTEPDIRLLDQFARLSVIAIENTRLFITASRRADELDALMRLGRAISANLDLTTILNTTYHCVGELMPNEAFWIASYQPGATYYEHLIKIDKGESYPVGVVELDVGVAGHTIRTGESIIWGETEIEQIFPLTGYGDEELVHSILCVPLRIGGKIIGAISAQSYMSHVYGQAELKLLDQLGQFVAIALENSHLYEEARQRAYELETVTEISAVLQTVDTVDEMLPMILQRVSAVVKASSGSIFLLDAETAELELRVSHPPGVYPIGLRHRSGEGITGYVAETGETYYATNFLQDSLRLALPGETETLNHVQSVVSVPLQTPNQLIGVMHLAFTERHEAKEEEKGLLTAVSHVAANALYRAGVMANLEKHVNLRTQELAQANERLTELDQLKSKFIGDISHELRTPIANLSLYLDLLERGRAEKREKYLNVLREKTNWLVQFTENILNISRLDMPGKTVTLSAVSLNKLVNSVISVYQPKIEAKGLKLLTQLGHTESWVMGDYNQLTQVVTHLLNNALNYTSEGTITIRILSNPSQQETHLIIQDSGMGISQADLPHIFDRFYRGQQIGQLNIPGYGLGLAMVKEIVALHKGHIQVKSAEQMGSTFIIHLPQHIPTPENE